MTTGPLSAKRKRLVPTALIMLSAIPVAAGASRVTQLTTGAQVTPDNARFFALPVPVILHIVGATVFCVLGAFQFAPGLRRRGWHRFAGRLVVPCGLIAALAGLWMTLYYPRPAEDGELYAAFRLVFGSTMVVALVLGYLAIRRRDFARHRAWMIRGYAIGQGAGTQALIGAAWMLLVGPFDQLSKALLMGAGWVINLAVAERIIRRQPALTRVLETR